MADNLKVISARVEEERSTDLAPATEVLAGFLWKVLAWGRRVEGSNVAVGVPWVLRRGESGRVALCSR